jgi:hypothetical protein
MNKPSFIDAIRHQQTARERHIRRHLRNMKHKLGNETLFKIWELQNNGVNRTQIAEQLELEVMEVVRLIKHSAWPSRSEQG